MPLYLVVLATPVVYQPDHPTARKVITEMKVSSDTEENAKVHVYRTTQGVVTITEVRLLEEKI